MIINLMKCPVCNEIFRNKDFVLINELNTISHLKCQDAYPFPLGIKKMGSFKIVDLYNRKNLIKEENQ